MDHQESFGDIREDLKYEWEPQSSTDVIFVFHFNVRQIENGKKTCIGKDRLFISPFLAY